MKSTGVKICLTGLLFSIQLMVAAQGYVENALQFGTTWSGGSARILGLGGAQVSLGGDFSSALSNPAGLGMYNRSEFTFSPALNSYKAEATYFGSQANDSKSVFNIPGLSYVHHLPADRSGFLGGSFGFSLTRTNDYQTVMQYEGHNTNSSIADFFVDQANGDGTGQFQEGSYNYNTITGLAYYNYLIGPQSILDPPGPDNQYFTDAPIDPVQHEDIETSGASNQWSLSYGGNYNDVFFFGAGIGIKSLRYKSKKSYYEDYTSNVIFDMQMNETTEIDGTGINATLGVIGRPAPFVQIGLSLVTPTYYKLASNYFAEMYTSWNNFDYYEDGSVILGNEWASVDEGGIVNDYSLTIPGKLSGGVTFITQYGFVSADVEMINPAKSKYRSKISGISFSPENDAIETTFASTVNYRFGGEFRKDIFRARLGYGGYGNPYQNDNIRYKSYYFSIGAGVRLKTFFIDYAFVNRISESYYFPYVFSDGYADPVSVDSSIKTSVFTVGFTF